MDGDIFLILNFIYLNHDKKPLEEILEAFFGLNKSVISQFLYFRI